MMYESIYDSLSKLVSQFRLEDMRNQIMDTYKHICKESLALPVGKRPPYFSTINEDGVPFQFPIVLGLEPRIQPLQFIGEVGIPGSSNAQRMNLSKQRISTLAPTFLIQDSN